MERIDLFPTEIWVEELNHIDNEELTKILLKKKQKESTVKSSLGYAASAGGSSWQSESDLHNIENTQLQNLLKSIGEVTDEIKRYSQFGKNIKTECKSMWANVNNYKDYNRLHMHPHCDYSGTYYVKTPENCGDIEFIDPRKEKRMLTKGDLWDSIDYLTSSSAESFIINPKEGKLILFPCFLEHGVEANQTHESRISISFNIVFKRHEI